MYPLLHECWKILGIFVKKGGILLYGHGIKKHTISAVETMKGTKLKQIPKNH